MNNFHEGLIGWVDHSGPAQYRLGEVLGDLGDELQVRRRLEELRLEGEPAVRCRVYEVDACGQGPEGPATSVAEPTPEVLEAYRELKGRTASWS